MYCPKCGVEIQPNSKSCPSCGFAFPDAKEEQTSTNPKQENASAPGVKQNVRLTWTSKIATALRVTGIAFFIIGIFCMYNAFDKKNNYYNSEYSTSYNENAYVGGDAYNYIINAGYFAGYAAFSGSMFICGTVCIINSLKIESTEKREEN